MCGWIITGFLAGLLARALMPGTQKMGFILTTLLGVCGAGLGGLAVALISGSNWHVYKPTSVIPFVGAVLGAMALLFIGQAIKKKR